MTTVLMDIKGLNTISAFILKLKIKIATYMITAMSLCFIYFHYIYSFYFLVLHI